MKITNICCIGAVSYTHLDVYKSQGYGYGYGYGYGAYSNGYHEEEPSGNVLVKWYKSIFQKKK